MIPNVYDRVRETSATTGTGQLTLAGAVTDFQSFGIVGNAQPTFYEVDDGTNWEVGVGVYTLSGTLLSRLLVLASSNSNAKVTLAGGVNSVFLPLPAQLLKAIAYYNGQLKSITVLTSGTAGNFGAQTTKAKIIGQAGGGGGGAAQGSTVGQSAGSGGGAAGGYFEKILSVLPGAAYTYAIGGSGAGGTASANGTAGGNTTFTYGGVTYTANGGPGGIAMTHTATVLTALGGASPAISVNGDLNAGGDPGSPGMVFTTVLALGGAGGNSPFGGAGAAVTGNGQNNATGIGSGGSGASDENGAGNEAGGAGSAGCIIVIEWT
jgi:hypothetical protein